MKIIGHILKYIMKYHLLHVFLLYGPAAKNNSNLDQWLIVNNKTQNQFYNNVYEVLQTPKAYELALRLIYFIDYNQVKSNN